MSDPNHEALLRLITCGGASAPRRKLLEAFSSPATALAAGASAWRQHGLDGEQIHTLQQSPDAALQRSLDWLAAPDHHLIGWHDPDYPALLRRIPSPPLALFVAGRAELLWHPAVALVGSRAPSAGGRDNAFDFARALANAGLAITSGLAAGIDTAAHHGALAVDGITVAVLGSGVDVAYPRSNATLMTNIASTGAVVSEYPPGTQPQRGHFPSRNRILAGLSLGTVVIEAAQRSGALITARLAAEAGREVFALPGSIHNPLARGCHRLIREGVSLVETPAEVVAALAPMAATLADALRGRLVTPMSEPVTEVATPVALPGANDPDYQRLWKALGHDPTGMDRLVARTALTAAQLSSMLLVMELEGRVVVETGGRYSRKS